LSNKEVSEMARHPNNKVLIERGKVVSIEVWANRTDGTTWRKIMITRQPTRFMVETNYLGIGRNGLNLPKTLEAALEGFEEPFADMAKALFTAAGLPLNEWVKITGSDFSLEMKG